MSIKNNIFIFLCFFFVLSTNGFTVTDLGVVGKTYKILENDFYDWITGQVKQNRNKVPQFNKKIVQTYLNKQLYVNFDLPDAREYTVKKYEPIYVLDKNIKDNNGNILYPAGYSYNVFDYISLKRNYFFLNAEKKEHILKYVEYAKKYPFLQPIIVKGSISYFYEVIQKLIDKPIPAGKASKLMLDKMFIKKLPSFVYQKEKKLVVEEIPVSR
jgi:hypothetical protein